MNSILIWQQNINKSPTCQHDIISNNILTTEGINIIALQEPHINHLNRTIASKDWIAIYPTPHGTTPEKTRAITLIRSSISTDNWSQIDFPSNDVTAIQIRGTQGKITIVNIYNEGKGNETINKLTQFNSAHHNPPNTDKNVNSHTIWLGDFNRHHPYWDDHNDTRLFTNKEMEAAEILIEAVTDAGLEIALPSGIPTHIHNVTKHWSRLDQVFLSDHSANMLILCNTQPKHRGINTDHLPIVTKLKLSIGTNEEKPIQNFQDVNWEEFSKVLNEQLAKLQPPTPIWNQRHLNAQCDSITKAIQDTISSLVLVSIISPKSKHWWTKELT